MRGKMLPNRLQLPPARRVRPRPILELFLTLVFCWTRWVSEKAWEGFQDLGSPIWLCRPCYLLLRFSSHLHIACRGAEFSDSDDRIGWGSRYGHVSDGGIPT